MKKMIMLAAVCTLIADLSASEPSEHKEGRLLGRVWKHNPEDNKIYNLDSAGGWAEQTYTDFMQLDPDALLEPNNTISIKNDEFKELCLQASRTINQGHKDGAGFEQLLAKMKNNSIDKQAPCIVLPEVEAYNSLLSYIPKIKGGYYELVNGKEVDILFRIVTRPVAESIPVTTQKIVDEQEEDDTDIPIDEEYLVLKRFQGRVFNSERTGEKELTIIRKDFGIPDHSMYLATIEAQFDTLLAEK